MSGNEKPYCLDRFLNKLGSVDQTDGGREGWTHPRDLFSKYL